MGKERTNTIVEEKEWDLSILKEGNTSHELNLTMKHSNKSSEKIIIDSGATLNIIRTKKILCEVKDVEPKLITYGNGLTTKIKKWVT
ncbi:Hypothetical protein SRAE_0000073800 [Strongyloides ratti]|uniref:Aspartic peptidase domain-containing protein n=1 Tax=Strongyloides ratti TaxID=34506 RepID=A0A090KW22_STRRB|nr:Hypothetical protein SRAE_0000073800 [Strongyloides ratti]CEF61621.1 Hypothetical protein SRAE_0000073800 [Strongyloides ratti]